MTTTTANDDVTAATSMEVVELDAPAPSHSAPAPKYQTTNSVIKHNQVAPYNDVISYGGQPAHASGANYNHMIGQAALAPQYGGGAAQPQYVGAGAAATAQPNVFVLNQPVSTSIYYVRVN